jgi:hypothetical protein
MKTIGDFKDTTILKFYRETRKELCKVINCSGGSGGLDQVYYDNTGDVQFSGSGTQADPLTATFNTATIPTLYSADFNGSLNRSVNMTYGSAINFNLADQVGNLNNYQLHMNTGGGGGRIWFKAPTGQLYADSGVFRLYNSDQSVYLAANATSFSIGNTLDTIVFNSNGTVSGSAATAVNQFVILSQLNTKADINSPIFTGIPTAPTASNGTSTTQLATTAFVYNVMFATNLTGFVVGANSSILATDTILGAFQKTQGQINALQAGTVPNNIKYGSQTFTTDGVIAVFNIPHGMGTTPSSFAITFRGSVDSNTLSCIRSVDGTNITLDYSSSTPPLTGTLVIDWQAFK